MELRVLRYFLAVAREENITAAAEVLHITQPTLSKQLMDLEKELGKQLFIRGKRKITLTEEGMFLRRRAQEIVELADKTQSEFLSNEDIISGDIYIGGGETDAMRIVAKTAKELQKNYPGIRYHLYSGNAQDVTERLDKGLLDFGILIGSSNLNKYDYIRLPVTDTWGLLMKKDSPLMDKDVISSADLKDLPLIVSIQALKTNELSGWSGYSFEDLNIVATYNLVYNATLMVDEGLGYVLTLDKLVNTSGGSKFCFKPLKPKLEAPLYIVWKKYQVFSKATEKFIEALQDLL
ncbi:LysR family transcriptional regulator [Anaerofustis stercorihominis]|uniref:Transcriptional regulator, LysR family n=2 Tax=Anaerofustis stercorihominis TaxID=214853 RepID=B1CAH2_9FIRM|nr:LysR family transcriptional regulator [Anaerofustis stercorihominis]EDS72445.1 transcriptional regulator, LysR family [Anaerofustis stercorihominis DSM 17244]MCQ4795314.1 LysR family transcriptional regulator [Anaerofustis stercorihominis]RGD73609.1 LysR family transcriptional regulator [Anaerofustis stercorihominis]